MFYGETQFLHLQTRHSNIVQWITFESIQADFENFLGHDEIRIFDRVCIATPV